MNHPVRNHFSSVIFGVLKNIRDFFFVFIAIIIKPSVNDILIILGIILLMIVYSVITWYKTFFLIKDNTLIYQTGALQKKVLNLSIEKITTIDLGENLINKVFGTVRLKIDSGSVKSGKAEIDIVLKKSDAINISDMLHGKKVHSDEEEFGRRFCVTGFELFLTAVTKNMLLLGLGIFSSMYAFLDDIFKAFNINYSDFLTGFINAETILNSSIINIIIYIIEGVLIVWLLCIVLSIVVTFIRFYNFTIYKTKDHIKISYGLINSKSFSLPIENIQAVILKQNFIKQKFGLYTIEVSSVGYGNEAKEEAILYPIAKKKLVIELLEEFLYDFKDLPNLEPAPKNTLINFIIIPCAISLLICSIATIIYSKAIITFLIMPIVIASSWMNYKNSALGFDDNILISSFGGFSKKIYQVKMKSLQSVTIKESPFQKKKSIGTFVIQYYSSKLGDLIKVKNIRSSKFEKLSSMVIKS